MRASPAGLELIKKNELVEPKMYHDQVGLPTIGMGHLLTKDELSSGKLISSGARWYNGLTDQQVDDLLASDILGVESAINSYVHVPLAQFEFDALASFIFNIGAKAFAKSTLLRLLNQDQFQSVPDQMRQWVHSKGQVLPVLVSRREREIAMWNGVPT
jgi:lysozyme